MTNNQKSRVLKMTLVTLQNAVAAKQSSKSSTSPTAAGGLTEAHVESALGIIQSVLNDKSAASPSDTVSIADIGQIILQILQIILNNLPAGTLAVPATDSSTGTTIYDVGETILQILELLLSAFGQGSGTASGAAPAAVASLDPVDIAGLILQILQLILSKFQTPAPAPTTAPAPAPALTPPSA